MAYFLEHREKEVKIDLYEPGFFEGLKTPIEVKIDSISHHIQSLVIVCFEFAGKKYMGQANAYDYAKLSVKDGENLTLIKKRQLSILHSPNGLNSRRRDDKQIW